MKTIVIGFCMVRFFCFISLISGPSLFSAAHAQEIDLNKALQSEYSYLISQREALLRQRQEMEASFIRRIAKAKANVEDLQRAVARASAENDERHEQLTQLEKFKRDLRKKGTALEVVYKRSATALREAEKALRFESNPDKAPIHLPSKIHLSDLQPHFEKADRLLRESARIAAFDGTYFNAEARLTQGKLTRVGRVAAFLSDGKRNFLLGPGGNGALTVLDQAESTDLFLFENLNEASQLRRSATWLERIADLGPLLFLLLMLGLVGGLFVVLVRT